MEISEEARGKVKELAGVLGLAEGEVLERAVEWLWVSQRFFGADLEGGSLKASSQLAQTPLDDLTYQIIGCAMTIHRKRGPGYREDTYHRDMEAHLSEAGLFYESERTFEVYDTAATDTLVGFYIPDFVVDNRVVVELKALNGTDPSHLSQVIGYLAVTGCSVGLLINFGTRSLQFHRIFPPKDIAQHQVNPRWLFIPDWLRDSEP